MAALSAAERRAAVAQILDTAEEAVSASALAKEFSVSRQIIVGDVALLRAAGTDISATPRGYVMNRQREGVTRTVACIHAPEDIERELTTIVDAGGSALDVVVDHPVYGQLTGLLGVSSRYDVEQFVNRIRIHKAKPLAVLTGGIHLHTIHAPDEATCDRVVEALEREGFLLKMP